MLPVPQSRDLCNSKYPGDCWHWIHDYPQGTTGERSLYQNTVDLGSQNESGQWSKWRGVTLQANMSFEKGIPPLKYFPFPGSIVTWYRRKSTVQGVRRTGF